MNKFYSIAKKITVLILTFSLIIVLGQKLLKESSLFGNSEQTIIDPIEDIVNESFDAIPLEEASLIKKEKTDIDVPLISQMPELYNGCEITSLTMLLNYKGVSVDKMTLSSEMIKDSAPLIRNSDGSIYSWGNPANGFVGDVTGKYNIGYSVDPQPLIPLIESYYTNGALDLTNTSLNDIEISLSKDNPVVAWVTADLSTPYDFRIWLDSNGNEVRATFQSHAVLLTGYDENNFYYNDPLNGRKNAIITKEQFEHVWSSMGSKALSVK